MKQNLPEELRKHEQREKKMNWYVSRDRVGGLKGVQTGCVNKEFRGGRSPQLRVQKTTKPDQDFSQFASDSNPDRSSKGYSQV